MFSLHSVFEGKPDHPMFDVAEARRLLAGLPKDDMFKALDEVTSWLTSLKDTPGFRPDTRTQIVMLLDETGLPFYTELLQLYLGEPHLQDFKGQHLWQVLHAFKQTLAEAYDVCVQGYQHAEKKPPGLKEIMPVVCVRLLRTVAEQMKLELMHYLDVEQSVWDQLFYCYNFSEASQFADTLVFAYPRQALHINPQRELVRAMMLYLSSPATLAPDQIEVSFRAAGRFSALFDLKDAPDPDCVYCIDLSKPGVPKRFDNTVHATPSMRFFGAVRAVPKITDMINQLEQGLIHQEQRFGTEFTPEGKLTVLKHLQLYWGKNMPHRHHERRGINTTIDVVHSFDTISKLVTHIDIGDAVNVSEKDAAKLKEKSKIDLAAEEEFDYTTETWNVLDLSIDGIGGTIPKTSGAWVVIGELCGVKAANSPLWWVGMIRRLHTDHNCTVHVGIEIFAKKPLSVWLRSLGKGAEKVSNWESSSGSFDYDYLPVILMPDASNSYANATLLMQTGSFIPGNIYQMMMGEKSRDIKFIGILAEGKDYEQVKFEWLLPGRG
jgi:hypothetical protein